MAMLGNGNIKMAVAAIRTSRWRSLLTMLGIIIGVASVITTVSLGEGIKQQIVGQAHQTGPDLITVRPGKLVDRDSNGEITRVNKLSNFNLGSLSEDDLKTIQSVPGLVDAVPFTFVSSVAHKDTVDYTGGPIIATTEGAARVLNQKVGYGAFFSGQDLDRNVAIIGPKVAEQLFQENAPIGQSFTIRNQTYVVGGVFENFTNSPLAINADYNAAIFIPYNSAKHIAGSQQQMYQVLVKPQDSTQVDAAKKAITSVLNQAHSGQTDFTVLTQAENLKVANSVLNILTSFVAGIAAISLMVGGIGIMNVMLVSVTERTREVGVRKAVGATNSQILGQFLIEAVILSFFGGIIGVLGAMVANYFLRVLTSLTPVITWPIVIVATGVSLVVGILFGIMPALRAARKDPIEALRYE